MAPNKPPEYVIPHHSQMNTPVSLYSERLCHKALGENIFQRSYHDHVIRGEADYLEIWQYIDSNAAKLAEDCFYNEAEEEETL